MENARPASASAERVHQDAQDRAAGFLKGRQKLEGYDVLSLVTYD